MKSLELHDTRWTNSSRLRRAPKPFGCASPLKTDWIAFGDKPVRVQSKWFWRGLKRVDWSRWRSEMVSYFAMNPEIIVAQDARQLVEMLAARLVVTARAAIEERGAFSLALSGGSTPKALYQALASPAWKSQIEWEKCDIVFGDDRAVAPDDALSNYRMARETLLDFVPARVHRIQTESADLERAAADYETVLRELGGRLDVVLLGLGDDGHTASLFPNSPQLQVEDKWVTVTPIASLEPHVRRVTLTFSCINAARFAWFLVVGAGKAARVYDILHGSKNIEKWPAQGVDLKSGETVWFTDEAAASELD